MLRVQPEVPVFCVGPARGEVSHLVDGGRGAEDIAECQGDEREEEECRQQQAGAVAHLLIGRFGQDARERPGRRVADAEVFRRQPVLEDHATVLRDRGRSGAPFSSTPPVLERRIPVDDGRGGVDTVKPVSLPRRSTRASRISESPLRTATRFTPCNCRPSLGEQRVVHVGIAGIAIDVVPIDDAGCG